MDPIFLDAKSLPGIPTSIDTLKIKNLDMFLAVGHFVRNEELLSNVVYSKLTLGGFPAVDCAFINSVDELHAGNHISELPEST